MDKGLSPDVYYKRSLFINVSRRNMMPIKIISKHVKTGTAVIILIILMTFLFSCSDKKSGQVLKKEAVPVTVVSVAQKTVPVQIIAIGNVEAYATVSVKSQVTGQLAQVHFMEGQDVSKGKMLFTIDPGTFEAQLKQAEAILARDTAQMENAQEEARRYEGLVKKGYVAREQYEQIRANASALEATVRADRAALENAHLQLKFCFIRSPIAGRTGNLLVNQGNLIKANDDKAMVVINQIQPVYVSFTVPEQNLPQIKKYMAAGKLKVSAFIKADENIPEEGVLTFIDNAVDTATGMIRLKASFDNKNKHLWPGQFVNIVITLAKQSDAIVVPSEAVQTGQQGQFVYIVKDDIAELRPVTAGVTFENITVIEKGLASGEQVVTDGQMRLMPGAKVAIKNVSKGSK